MKNLKAMENIITEKREWVTPEIMDLDVEKTGSGGFIAGYESGNYRLS